VQAIMSNPTSLLPLMTAKRLKPLAVTSRTRWSPMKHLPTVAKAGLRISRRWHGTVLWRPQHPQATTIEHLNREINVILSNPKSDHALKCRLGHRRRNTAAVRRLHGCRAGTLATVIARSGARLD